MTSHRATLARARAALARLVDAERDWLATQPYRLAHEHDMRGARYLVRVRAAEPPPAAHAALAAHAGDVLRTLRDALDELASALADAPVRFPITESLPQFAQRARKAIARMPDEAQAGLEALQPYHAIGGFRNGPLWILQQLAAEDPPRLAAGALRAGAAIGVNTQRKVALVGEPAVATGAFEAGAVVASVATKIVGPDPKLDLFLRADFALAFAERGPARGREVVALLGELCDHVDQVVFAALEAAIPARAE